VLQISIFALIFIKTYMKKIILIVLLLLAIGKEKVYATHAAGGEIVYQWLSDSTYRFYFYVYRDCSGIEVQDTVSLCFKNTCNPTASFSVLLNKAPGANGVADQTCAQYKTNCDSMASTINGFAKWVYSGVVTMPAQCNAWKVSGWISSRNTNHNTTLYVPFYAETIMNNAGSNQGNSSPYFTISPVLRACTYSSNYYPLTAVDPDGDSLAYEMTTPRYTTNNCSETPINMTFVSGLSATQPITGSFYLGPTGWVFTAPTMQGVSIFTVRTKEYRNGILISQVDREMQVIATPCAMPYQPATFTVPVTPLYSCAGQPVNFCWVIKANKPGARIKGFDNAATIMPGAVVTYTGQGTDSVRGCLTWTPTAPTDNLIFDMWAQDSTCDGPGYLYYGHDGIIIKIFAPADAGKDTAICPGGAVQLDASGHTGVTWSVISGTPNSLSCTNCTVTTATPLETTKYELLVTGSSSPCPNTKDTVTITMLPYNKPSVSITVSPDTNVASGTTVTFTATPSFCNNPTYQWQRNGGNLPGAMQSTFSTPSLINQDVITVKMTCTDTCTIDTVSNKLKMHITAGINDRHQASLAVQPNPNAGEFVISGNIAASEMSIEVINVAGQIVYSQQAIPVVNGELNHKLSITHIADGNYLIRIKAANGVLTQRLVIQH
jgi:hypothetical protein